MMSRLQTVIASAALLAMPVALGACASNSGTLTNAAARSAPVQAEYRIGPEDLIEVVVWNNDAVGRQVPVRPDGMISLPLVNDVRAAGLTPIELRDQLVEKFQKFIPSPVVSVIVQEVHSPKVLLVGEVVNPGRYELKSPTTLLDIIAQAGGLTEFAWGSRTTIVRTLDGKTEHIRVDARPSADRAASGGLYVQPGDVVVVP